MSSKAKKVSDAELEVMKVLWLNKVPMTERQIRDALEAESNWSQTTIKTLIKRLFEKDVIEREPKEVYYYSPLLSEAEFAKERTQDLLNKVFGGNAKGLVSTMLNNDILSEADMDDLKSYWQERKVGK